MTAFGFGSTQSCFASCYCFYCILFFLSNCSTDLHFNFVVLPFLNMSHIWNYTVFLSFLIHLLKCIWHSIEAFLCLTGLFLCFQSSILRYSYIPQNVLFCSFRGQKSKVGFTGLKASCQQNCVLSGGWRVKIHIFAAWIPCLIGPFSFFKSSLIASHISLWFWPTILPPPTTLQNPWDYSMSPV